MRIAVVVVGLVLLAGCGDDGGDAVSDAPLTSMAPGRPPVGGDANPGAPEVRQVTPEGGLANPNPAAIESGSMIDDTTIELRFYSGVQDCYGLDRVEVDAGDEAVTVTVFVGSRPGDRACIEIAELVATKVTLDDPLGARTLVDGATGEPVPVD